MLAALPPTDQVPAAIEANQHLQAFASLLAGQWVSGVMTNASLGRVTNATVTATSSAAMITPAGVDLYLQPVVTADGVTANAVTVGFNQNAREDGTYMTTTTPITASVQCNGTNQVVGLTIISKTNLARPIRWDSAGCVYSNGVSVKVLWSYAVRSRRGTRTSKWR